MEKKYLTSNIGCLSEKRKTVSAFLAVVVLFVFSMTSTAQVAGPNNPTTSGTQGANVNWANTNEILVLDNTASTVNLNSGQSSRYLTGSGYGFAIPGTATINGILVTIRRGSSSNNGANINDVNVRLMKAGTLQGNNLAVPATDWNNSWTNVNYGGTTNLWGSTWTPAEINNAGFGVGIMVDSDATRTGYVDSMRITVYYTVPLTPTITSFSPTGYCQGTTPLVTINGTNLSGTTAVSFNGVPATSFNNISSTQITATPSVGLTSGAVSVTTPGGTANGSFTLYSNPTVNPITGSAPICPGNTVQLSNTTPSGTWTSLTPLIATVNATTGLVTGVAGGTATIRYSVTNGNGCTTAVTTTVTVNANPVLSGPSSVCPGATINLSPSSGGNWVANNPGVATISNAGVVTGITPGIATFTFTDSTTGCSATTGNITVNTQPSISSDPNPVSVCSGNSASFTVSATGAGLTYQWYNGATLLSNGGNISGATSTTLTINPVNLSDASANYHCVVSGTCSPSATSANAGLTVTERVIITAQPATTQTHCENDSVSFTIGATGAGLTYQWYNGATLLSDGGNISGATTATLTLNPVATSNASANYHCIVSGTSPCNPVNSAMAALVVNSGPAITVEPVATQTVCAGANVSFSVTATGGNLIYQWYNGATPLSNGGNISGAASATLSISNTTPANSSNDYHVVVSNGCVVPAVSISAVLVVNERPYIPAQNTTICSEDAFDATPTNGIPTAATIVPAGTTYSWPAPVVTGGITGGSAQSGQAAVSQTLINPTNVVQTATYTVTPTSGTAGNCVGTAFTVVVTVNPRPFIINTTQTACSGTTFSYAPTNGGGNIIPAGTTYSWGLPVLSGVVGGATTGTNQPTISQNLTNTTGSTQTATYTVTASNGTCIGSTFNVIFNVYPTPTVAGTPTTQTICSGTAITSIVMTNPNGVSGTIDYSWTRNNTVNVTGIGGSGFGDTISGTLTNTTNTPQTVTFSLTATSEFGCASNVPFTVDVIVNPRPTVSATPASQTVCSGNAIANINIANPNSVVGTTYSWTRDNTANLTGIAASGSSSTISGSLTNTTNVAQTTTFTIMTSAAGCDSAPITVTVTVNPQPTVSASPATQTLCSALPFTTINISNPNAVSGTTFNWTRDNVATVTGLGASGNGTSIAGTLTNTTNAVVTVTFTITATAAGCPSATTTAQITLDPAPNMTRTPATQNVCTGSNMATITFTNTNSVPGTVYSWTRSNTTNVTGIANSGNSNIITGTPVNNTTVSQITVITMIATAPNGCSIISTASVTVYPNLVAPVIGENQTVCEFASPGAITQTTPVAGGSGTYTYQWQRSLDGLTGWANAPGASTGASYTPGLITGATPNYYYRLVVTNPCGSVTSNSVLIQVVDNVGFTFNMNGQPGAAICPGTTFTPSISSIHSDDAAIRFNYTIDNTYLTSPTPNPTGTTSPRFWFLVWLRTSEADFSFTAQNTTNATVVTPISIVPNIYDYPGPPTGAFQCSITPQVFNVSILPRPVATITSPPDNSTICSATSAGVTVSGNITDGNMYYTVTRSVNALVTSSVTFPYTSANFTPGQSFVFPDVLTNLSAANQNVTYTITPRSTAGCVGTPVTITIIVARPVTPGTVAANQTLCSPADPAAFTETIPATGTSLSYQWYSSTVAATGPWTLIPGATAITYDAPAGLTQTTWYRREVTSVINGVPCSVANTTPIQVTINNVTAGAIAGDLTICNGDDPPAFTSSAPGTATGTLSYFWEYSTVGCSGPWTLIGSSNTAAYNPGPLTQTTYYRRTAVSTIGIQTCSATSNCVTITVNQVNGGTVGSDQTLCGNNPAAFTVVAPATGSGVLTYQWQSTTSASGCASPSGSWANIPGATSATYDPPAGLTQTTYYRRITTSTFNGVQCTALSNCITVTANSVTPGVIASNQTVCSGGDPAAFTVTIPATGTGLTYQWQSSTVSAAGPWTNIPSANAATYDPPAGLTQTTHYQRVVTGTVNAVSCDATSNSLTVFVNDVTAPVMAGDQTICAGENPAAFTIVTAATANGALSYQWQSNTIGCGGPWTNIGGATSATYDPPVLAQTTYYHVIVTSTLNSVNCTATSNCITVTGNGKTWNGSAGTDWNNAANWTPAGVPTNMNCVVIPNVTNDPIISGVSFVGYALNLTILNGGNLSVTGSNTIEVTNFVNVNAGGAFNIADDASLNQIDNVANVGTMHMQRTTPPVYRFDYTYWNSPVTLASNYTLGNLSPNTQSDKFYSWNPSVAGGNGNWIQESVATIMNPNKGYIVRAPNGYSNSPMITAPYTATFIGTPNNGSLTAPVAIGSLPPASVNDKLNLIGNPYPSALDADLFLAHPTNVNLLDGTLYFWTHHSPPSTAFADPFYGNFTSNYTASDYATYTTGMGGTSTVPAGYGGTPPTGFVATGQSFFVKALASGNAVFENNMRVRGNNNVFFRQANPFTTATPTLERHRIWLNLANTQGAFSQILVGYAEGATNARDRNFDGETFAGNAVTFYSTIEDVRLTVQGRALPFETSDLVPLGYKATVAATFTVGVDHLDGLFETQNVYLEDKLLNVIHDLKSAPYSFASAVGTFNDRFVLRYTNEQLGVGDHELQDGVVAFISDDKLFAQASLDIISIEIFDVNGKKITTYEPQGNTFESSFNFAQGIYIAKVKLSDDNEFDIKLAH
ncbi:immunoglobulin domain-containing protein [Flavobacterium sp. MAH-1]|uniref:Immunoglobulin domain-containing protein n=1 Tax=Flavobacterium agri TaxID=2743471 RepID=A0A7Y9C5A9_9FLAO|nr:PKD-like domain-containing protein [Flavobacterium agri]NUY80791.1 immunoglobulin domain-containing protein [Flavobacterium agri]NYA70815.1 immunoglobulin domain-containing protein [Flavobacterium agri]